MKHLANAERDNVCNVGNRGLDDTASLGNGNQILVAKEKVHKRTRVGAIPSLPNGGKTLQKKDGDLSYGQRELPKGTANVNCWAVPGSHGGARVGSNGNHRVQHVTHAHHQPTQPLTRWVSRGTGRPSKGITAGASGQSRHTIDESHTVFKESQVGYKRDTVASFPVAVGVDKVVLPNGVLNGSQ